MQQIGHYTVRRELGRGAMGVVLLAFDTLLHRDVAIKLLLGVRPGSRQQQRFEREIQVLARLKHPNVVPVLSAGRHEQHLYLVMELVDGETLSERLHRAGPLSPGDAARLVQKLASALDHAHQAGVLHRDVKPANVLIRKDGEPLLTDFGLALEPGSTDARLSATGAAIGTPGYWPPEQAFGQLAQIGPASDVYSLGATLYTALTGRPPLRVDGSSLAELRATLEQKPAPPSQLNPAIPATLDAVCLRCLEKEPARRFRSAAELAQALAQRADGSPPARQRKRSSPPSKRGGLGLGISLAVAVGAIGLGLALRQLETAPPEETAPPAPEAHPQPAAPTPAANAPRDPAPTVAPNPDEPRQRAEEAFEEGKALEAEGRHARAADAYRRSLELAPDTFAAWTNLGNCLFSQGQLAPAMKAYNRAMALEPTSVQPRLNRAVAFATGEDWAGAASELRAALAALGPGHPSQAKLQRMLGDAMTREATSEIRSDDEPLDLPAPAQQAMDRGGQLAGQGDPRGAIAAYSEAARLAPECASVYNNRGVVYATAGQPQEALSDFARALELDPEHAETLGNRAQIHSQRADWQAAIADWDRFLELRSTSVHGLYNRGFSHESRGDPAAALADYTRALELDPSLARGWLRRGYMHVDLKDRPSAVEALTRYLELRPWDAIEHANRGNVRRKLGDLSGARADFEQALALLRPDDPKRNAVQGLLRQTKAKLGE